MMRHGCKNSWKLEEIDAIYLEGCNKPGFYKKEDIHEYLKGHPRTIQVKTWPNPYLIPAVSIRGEKYVHSSPNRYLHDNLLDLPRS